MKYAILFFLLPFQLVAQKPLRHYDFVSRKQPGMYVGEFSISPKGTMLLATFNDFGKTAVHELVSTSNGIMLSQGALPSIPHTITWTSDEKMVAISYRDGSVICYEMHGGMKKIFTASREGLPVFSRNAQLLRTNFVPELFVFGEETIFRYNLKGTLLDSVDTDDFLMYDGAWYDLLRNRFVLATDGIEGLLAFSPNEKKIASVASDISTAPGSDVVADKDGSIFFFDADNTLYVHDAANGKKITQYRFDKIVAASFTPDSKKVLVFDDKNVNLIDLQGKLVRTARRPGFYSCVGYTAFGTEMIAAQPEGFDVYACKDYFFANVEPVVNKPPVTIEPVKTTPPKENPQPVIKEKPWSLPYTIREFITPLNKDSFYLYSNDRGLRYFIRYEKMPPGGLWQNSFSYSQFFGVSSEVKYLMVTNYILDMTDSTARMGTYSKAGAIEKEVMFGGPAFLAKLSSSPGLTLTWPMKIYEEE
jgi:hypothetical protein